MAHELPIRDSAELRPALLIALLVGALGSAGLTLYAGRIRLHSPALLATLFVMWVCSPFLGEVLAYRIFVAGRGNGRATMDAFIFVLSGISLVLYGAATFASARPMSPVFVMTPAASWIAIVVALTWARKKVG